MWESPVNIMEIQEPIIEQFNKEREEMVLKQIWKIGVDVNKEELIKALQYDRGQYEKGYSDGYAKGIDEFAERMSLEISESIIWDMLATMSENGSLSDTSDKIVDYVVDTAKKIADQLKGGAE